MAFKPLAGLLQKRAKYEVILCALCTNDRICSSMSVYGWKNQLWLHPLLWHIKSGCGCRCEWGCEWVSRRCATYQTNSSLSEINAEIQRMRKIYMFAVAFCNFILMNLYMILTSKLDQSKLCAQFYYWQYTILLNFFCLKRFLIFAFFYICLKSFSCIHFLGFIPFYGFFSFSYWFSIYFFSRKG